MDKRKLLSPVYPLLQRLKFLKQIIEFNSVKEKVNPKKILFYSSTRGELGGNLLCILNYIKENNPDFETVVSSQAKPICEKELIFHLKTSAFILIDDFQPLVYVLKFSPEQKLIQLWHAMGAFKKFGYSRESAVKNSLTHKNYSLVTVSSEDVRNCYAEAFSIDKSKVLPLGVARTDMLFSESRKVEVQSRLYSKEPSLKGKKVLLFAPTFRGENVNNAYYPNEFMDIAALCELLGNDWAVIIKMHPFIKNSLKIPDEVKNRAFDFSDEREINDILFITDVLVTDYSSVIFESAVLNVPFVLYTPDLEEYTKSRGFYYDFSAYGACGIAENLESLANAVKNVKNSKGLEQFKERFVSSCDGASAKRFVEIILAGDRNGL